MQPQEDLPCTRLAVQPFVERCSSRLAVQPFVERVGARRPCSASSLAAPSAHTPGLRLFCRRSHGSSDSNVLSRERGCRYEEKEYWAMWTILCAELGRRMSSFLSNGLAPSIYMPHRVPHDAAAHHLLNKTSAYRTIALGPVNFVSFFIMQIVSNF